MDGYLSEKLPSNVLIDSRTVVEKKDYVSTGVLTFAEGDLIEIEISEYKMFALGDSVKVTVYSPAGIFSFKSNVIALDENTLIVVNPPENQKKFVERREHPRVPTNKNGFIRAIEHREKKHSTELSEPVKITIHDISVGGIGFQVQDLLDISTESHISLHIDIGTEIQCVAEVIRQEKSELGVHYGAKYVQFPDDKLNTLRAFVLRTQVESYLTQKRENIRKQRFFK